VELPRPSRSIVLVVHGPLAPTGPLVCDVSQITVPDEHALEALARLQLIARRSGTSIRLDNADERLVDLIAIVGLAEVLRVVESGVESDRQVEEREQVGIDEVVDCGDDAR
jgi:anti-anti-sigma regulatory factor